MTIRHFRELVIKHLDNYSQNGEVLSEDNPIVLDYYLRIPDFINYAVTLISRTVPSLSPLALGEPFSSSNGFNYFTLPNDFLGIGAISSSTMDAKYINLVSVVGNLIAIPINADSISIMYKVLPVGINNDTSVTSDLPLREDFCSIAALYVCAMLTASENANVSTRFLNQFENELYRINDTNFSGCDFPVSTTGWI